ncbi:MAG: 3-phosphoshikimate 1-carboxyvinyltransferase [Actinomycetota bacterium]|jgi:3-phosphoshikimate 1-carboxyvinyltransferase
MSVRTFSTPQGALSATVRVPGSKSVANRALICALLAEGESRISGLPDGDDTSVIIDVLEQIHRFRSDGDVAVIVGSRTVKLPGIIDAQLAGTSSRFLTAVAALGDGTCIVDGGEPLRGRPMADLHEALISLGAELIPLGELGHLPVSVSAGSMVGGQVDIRGDVSSQFISALMLIAPMLGDGLVIKISGELVSRSYVEMTAAVMHAFGAQVVVNESTIAISPGGYVPCDYVVEPDFSSAAFPLCALAIKEGSVRIPQLGLAAMQGDSQILNILTSMGCIVQQESSDVIVSRSSTLLRGIDINMADCSDLVPAVAVAMLFASTPSRITGVGFIRRKESDRLGDLAHELRKVGAVIEVEEDGLFIQPLEDFSLGELATYHDHRLAMAFSLLALAIDGVAIQDSEVVSKSWPSFFSDMAPILGASTAQH